MNTPLAFEATNDLSGLVHDGTSVVESMNDWTERYYIAGWNIVGFKPTIWQRVRRFFRR